VARPKKVQHFKLKPYRNTAGTNSWRITGTKPDGTRIRQNFADKNTAIQKLADLESEIEGHVAVTQTQRTRLIPQEIADAEAAIHSAKGRKISTIVSDYLALEARATSRGMNLQTAIAFAEAHYRHEIQVITILNAHRQFVDSRVTESQKTSEHYESAIGILLKPDPNKEIHTFTLADIEKILGRYKNLNSKKTYFRAFKTFFRWAVRHHYCLEDPCSRMDKLPKDMSQISTLSLEEATRLLYASIIYKDGTAASAIAIGLFAGLRPSEIRDLKSEDILKEKIRVSGGKLRRTLKRSVPIPPVLATWLAEYPFKGLPSGWDSKMRTLKKAAKAKKWVQDIIRHTSITFQTERDKNEALTAYNCGTSIQMMNRHYRDTIDDDKTVTDFWNLTPIRIRKEKPEVDLPAARGISWPPKTSLQKLVWQKPLVHAAADLGVSDVALKKHCVKLGIKLPPRGHWVR